MKRCSSEQSFLNLMWHQPLSFLYSSRDPSLWPLFLMIHLFLLVSFIFLRLNLENTFSVWIYITHSKIRNKLMKNNIESDMLNWLQCFSINIIQKLKWERTLFLPYLAYSMLLGFWTSEQGWNSGSTLEMQLDRSRIELEPPIVPRRKEKESEDNNNQLTNQTTIRSES